MRSHSLAEIRGALPDTGLETAVVRGGFPEVHANPEADTGLLCSLLRIDSEDALRRSPWAAVVWETFVCAQLRHRERRAGRANSLFFWRDRTREVDVLVEAAGRVELFEAKWTEPASAADAVNLVFVRDVVGTSRVTGGTVVCRAPNGYLLPNGFRVSGVDEIVERPAR